MDFDPAEFLRKRRPELFPDSEPYHYPLLTRELLEYQLETLTNRKQEAAFEYFCRRLVEKEICPNLRPQTGPTGGGDSKADSETIPVSSEISIRWIGSDPNAASERWAFAFSAKKKWTPKVRSDVKELALTGRGYRRIYCITNQFARDKTRAKLEDELSKQHKTQVTILDRSWIIKCVIEHKRFELAIEALGITSFSEVVENRRGPRDTQLGQELAELDAQIADPTRYAGADFQLVEDSLRAAVLSRNLGLPRTEVDGRFVRAETIATNRGSRQQRLRIAYEVAWTAFWWFKDYDELCRGYEIVEQRKARRLA